MTNNPHAKTSLSSALFGSFKNASERHTLLLHFINAMAIRFDDTDVLQILNYLNTNKSYIFGYFGLHFLKKPNKMPRQLKYHLNQMKKKKPIPISAV